MGSLNKFATVVSALAFTTVSATAQDRLPPIPTDKMNAAQKKAAADYRSLQNSDPAGPPWSVLLRTPDMLVPSLEMRLHNRRNSALSAKLTELAILIAARHWTANFEWNAHSSSAIQAGLSQTTLAAIADGRRPENMSAEEEILYAFCSELLQNQSVSDATYARALAAFGEAGVVEAATLEGYYSYLAIVMNAARTPLPAGVKPALTPFPRN
jgi:4-carboxymuconolactone decarboxylase